MKENLLQWIDIHKEETEVQIELLETIVFCLSTIIEEE